MLLGVICLEKGKELKASATLQGDGESKPFFVSRTLAPCNLLAVLTELNAACLPCFRSVCLPCHQELFINVRGQSSAVGAVDAGTGSQGGLVRWQGVAKPSVSDNHRYL